MLLIPAINGSKTKKQARQVLSQYRRLKRICGRSSIDLRSPIMSDMPKANGGAENKTENAIVEKLNAEWELNAIIDALTRLPYISRQILSMTYCESRAYQIFEIGRELGYTEKNIERLKGIALIEFAEAYKHGKLLITNSPIR